MINKEKFFRDNQFPDTNPKDKRNYINITLYIK